MTRLTQLLPRQQLLVRSCAVGIEMAVGQPACQQFTSNSKTDSRTLQRARNAPRMYCQDTEWTETSKRRNAAITQATLAAANPINPTTTPIPNTIVVGLEVS